MVGIVEGCSVKMLLVEDCECSVELSERLLGEGRLQAELHDESSECMVGSGHGFEPLKCQLTPNWHSHDLGRADLSV